MLKRNSSRYILYPVSCVLLIVFCFLYSVSCFAVPPRDIYPETEIKRFQSLLDLQLNAGTAAGQMLYWDTTTPSWNATDTPAAADRMPFWDNSATKIDWLTPGNGLTITGTDIDWSASGIAGHDLFSDYVANEHIDWTSASDDLTTTGLGTFGNLDVDTLNLNGNVISDSTGTIDFSNENLTTTGVVSVGSTLNTTRLLNLYKNSSTVATGVYGTILYTGSVKESFGADFQGWCGSSNANPRGFGGRFQSVLWSNAASGATTVKGFGGYFTSWDYPATYRDAKFDLYAGYFVTPNARGDWTTYNPTIRTARLFLDVTPTGYGSNHVDYAIYSAGGQSVHAGNMRIGDVTAPTDALEVTGIKSSVIQTTTLGVGATTFAITQNIIELTGDGGTNTIATITGASIGTEITIIFTDGNVTITDDNSHAADSVDLSAAFTSADDTVLGLVYNGTNWYEKSRSVN